MQISIRKKCLVLVITFLLFFISSASLSVGVTNNQIHVTNQLKTIYVDDDNIAGPWNGSINYPYQTIQSGINAASNGDTVYTFNGTYNQKLTINKEINLIGENKDITIINGGGSGRVIVINADFVTISGFTIQNGGYWDPGIDISVSNYITISNNIIENTGGISLFNSIHNTIEENTLSNNNFGVSMVSSSNNEICDNIILNNEYGAYIFFASNNNILFMNVIAENNYGIYLYGSLNNTINENNIEDNTLSGIEFFGSSYINRISNTTISNNLDGIYIEGGSENTIFKCDIHSNKGNAIVIYDSERNSITNCDIHDNTFYGVLLTKASSNTIKESNITKNLETGLLIWNTSKNNTIKDNLVSYNKEGISFKKKNPSDNSDNNNIFHNSFLFNEDFNAYDQNSNIWDIGYPFGGNCWSDYAGGDQYRGPNQDIPGGDGIGDIPYEILGGDNIDRYPILCLGPPPPIVNITRPLKNTLYFANRSGVSFPSTVIIGKLEIQVKAYNNYTEMDKVEFFIDEVLVFTDYEEPYTWMWDDKTLFDFKHTIKVIGYDDLENTAEEEIEVLELL